MPKHVALLRGINVGGHNLVAMADLRALFEDLGLGGARTLLQSGNVVFDGGRRTAAALEALLARETARRLGVAPDYFVRTARAWADVVAGNPFPREAEADPGHLVVAALASAPSAARVQALQASIRGPEVVRARGPHLYVLYPEGIGRSKLTPALLEKGVGARATARNWNTVTKIAALLEA